MDVDRGKVYKVLIRIGRLLIILDIFVSLIFQKKILLTGIWFNVHSVIKDKR